MWNPAAWALELVLNPALVLIGLMFLAVILLEWLVPARNISSRHYGFNLCYAVVNGVAIAAATPFISAGTARAFQSVDLGLIDLRVLGFNGIAGGLIALVVGTLVLDFFQYWGHRAFHGSKILWQQHLLHHSDEYMNFMTAARHHPIEIILVPVFVTIPMGILFKLPPINIAELSLIPYAWDCFAHSNVRLGFGPLWWLLVSPNYHRVHHSLEPHHIDRNFAMWFPIWDIIFGTAVAPRSDECPGTGVAGVSVETIGQAYLQPLLGWRRMWHGKHWKMSEPTAIPASNPMARSLPRERPPSP
jgi:sterol desaturase/sphingolipid hydroxylase (fatty acid hydroxylase superfamily)